MGINSYGEAWHVDLHNRPHGCTCDMSLVDYLESELELIDRALSHALDALESDSTLEQRRRAFEMIQDLYDQNRILSQMYPSYSIKHCLPDGAKEETNG